GISYDWDREVRTFDPGYYKWTQWLFLLLYKNGWAYRAPSMVNWCVNDGILANEQVHDGKCWRCKGDVVKKAMGDCWYYKYSAMAERLNNDLEKLTGWPESTKAGQLNWIGKSTGCEIDFTLAADPVVASDPIAAKAAIDLMKSKGYTPIKSDAPTLTVFTT